MEVWRSWAQIPKYVPTLCLDSGIVSPLQLLWVKGVYMYRCNLPPALLAKWRGSFTCLYSNTGVERTPSKTHHAEWNLEKKILPLLLRGCELATYWSRVWSFTNKLSRLPSYHVHIWLAFAWCCCCPVPQGTSGWTLVGTYHTLSEYFHGILWNAHSLDVTRVFVKVDLVSACFADLEKEVISLHCSFWCVYNAEALRFVPA